MALTVAPSERELRRVAIPLCFHRSLVSLKAETVAACVSFFFLHEPSSVSIKWQNICEVHPRRSAVSTVQAGYYEAFRRICVFCGRACLLWIFQ